MRVCPGSSFPTHPGAVTRWVPNEDWAHVPDEATAASRRRDEEQDLWDSGPDNPASDAPWGHHAAQRGGGLERLLSRMDRGQSARGSDQGGMSRTHLGGPAVINPQRSVAAWAGFSTLAGGHRILADRLRSHLHVTETLCDWSSPLKSLAP